MCCCLQVLDTPVHILAVTDTLVAVAKPASMPVHPTARAQAGWFGAR